jgi:hypothetical protein
MNQFRLYIYIEREREMSQGNAPCSYPKQTKCLLLFTFTKLENRRAKHALPGGWYQWGRGVGGYMERRVNMV